MWWQQTFVDVLVNVVLPIKIWYRASLGRVRRWVLAAGLNGTAAELGIVEGLKEDVDGLQSQSQLPDTGTSSESLARSSLMPGL